MRARERVKVNRRENSSRVVTQSRIKAQMSGRYVSKVREFE